MGASGEVVGLRNVKLLVRWQGGGQRPSRSSLALWVGTSKVFGEQARARDAESRSIGIGSFAQSDDRSFGAKNRSEAEPVTARTNAERRNRADGPKSIKIR